VLVSLYVPEDTTAAAELLVRGEIMVAVSSLTLLETYVALERKRKAGKLLPNMVAAVRARMEVDVTNQRLQMNAVEEMDYRRADGISQRVHSPIRSLDALHAAVAQRLGM
jgi:predicted nucleic acid-binding protein